MASHFEKLVLNIGSANVSQVFISFAISLMRLLVINGLCSPSGAVRLHNYGDLTVLKSSISEKKLSDHEKKKIPLLEKKIFLIKGIIKRHQKSILLKKMVVKKTTHFSICI